MKIAYFVGGCLGAITSSSFLKLLVRTFPYLNFAGLIILAVVVVIGLAVAVWFSDDAEQGLQAWFTGVCALLLGVMLGAI